MTTDSPADQVLRCDSPAARGLAELLAPYGLKLVTLAQQQPIPGSYWGDSEAGLVGDQLMVRGDTPIHSALHEACHYICMDDARRGRLHTDAGGDDAEENAVCYLQILLADQLPGIGRARLMADMDAWGYSFRLGSSQAWFEQDAEEARQWLFDHAVIDQRGQPTRRLRQ